MRQTLFYIPAEIGGLPLFGVGLMLAVWAVATAVMLTVLIKRQGWNADTKSYLPLLGLVGLVIWLVLPNLCEPQGLPVRGYGVMLMAGVVSGMALALSRARRRGVDPEIINRLALGVFICGIAGARLFYVIEYWQQFQRPTLLETLKAMINIPQGGLVVYGSVFGAGLALVVFVRRNRLPGMALADLVAPCVLVGLALGRIGCFLNGCCYGGVCELPWGVRFPYGSPPYVRQAQDGKIFVHGLKIAAGQRGEAILAAVEPGSEAESHGLKRGDWLVKVDDQSVTGAAEAEALLLQIHGSGSTVSIETADNPQAKQWQLSAVAERSLPTHPAQLYSTMDATLICLFLLAYEPFKRRDGELTAWMLTIYSITRFLMEIIRTDESAVFGTGLSISQNVSLLVLLGALGLWVYLSRQPRVCLWPVLPPAPSAPGGGSLTTATAAPIMDR